VCPLVGAHGVCPAHVPICSRTCHVPFWRQAHPRLKQMKLLVTGAGGFFGQSVVTEAVRRGHNVRAVLLPAASDVKMEWYARDRIEVVRADLRSRRGLVDVVQGVDCVLHLAACKRGDIYTQYAGTVVATENLLAAMTEAGVHRIVAISSLSVYDAMKMRVFSTLDENSPLETDAFDRDEYAHTKLVQERLIRDHAVRNNWDLVVLRPGVIWGKGELFNSRVGLAVGKRIWIRTGAWAPLPLTYVENCAEATVLAAESKVAQGQTLNIIDDEQPTQRRFASMLRKRMLPRPIIIPVSFTLMRLIAAVIWFTNKQFFGGRAKVPGLFVPARLHARLKPLRYSNQKVRQVLGWTPRYSLEEALDRSIRERKQPAPAQPSNQLTIAQTEASVP
jgi:2-alkyl-3-oxoalkanoate reductase